MGVKNFPDPDHAPALSENAITLLERRYLLKNARGEVTETPDEMFRRVAHCVASADLIYGDDAASAEQEFYHIMRNLYFLPNSPTLMNAGTDLGQLSACFVLPIFDSLSSIFDSLKYMALIQQSGGGTGFSFSKLRPEGDIVRSTKGVASGPVSFMSIFDVATEVIKQGGRRRGANIGILDVTHPDIMKFVRAKKQKDAFQNFNISVAVTDSFMHAASSGESYQLINPRTGEAAGEMDAGDLFDLIVSMAWEGGEPGILFIDEINRNNPTPQLGMIEATNPCAEQPLLPYESCNLGSINLARMMTNDGEIDWDRLASTVRTAVHFLDNVIDVNRYPLPQIEAITRANRKIGLGVMGFAELLFRLRIPYNSEEGVEVAERVMSFISREARKKSQNIAESRGSFKNFEGSLWDLKGYTAMRNATLTTIAPTGSISIIAGTTSGIEPLFAISFVHNVIDGTRLVEINSVFEEVARRRGFYSHELMQKILRTGSISEIAEIPDDVKDVFQIAMDISPDWHVKMQAAFQRYVDNGVSKTVNLPPDATIESVREVFLLAFRLKCKGITVYRYKSRGEGVLTPGCSGVICNE
ncbi:MAG: ribonucleotide-diphosphate reductase subunit alpha [Candidatus Syntrophoarchaeum caldarius]|uniref:Vitamin B12-dependent ribonucleotide reductase n=1 Tax=Candidatus Syntropharchaeum caldarium TaxID=1838285 RepID=A0A1F2PBZ7_9EURY|nr:MAG: ribonucleotide-diphosphate reductase subunit alpha [Candidatus Syntrophoarchaeum caldarius]